MTFLILKDVQMIFLKNVRYRFKVTGKKWVKCSLTIENIQKIQKIQHMRI